MNFNFSNFTVATDEALLTCGDWCREQHYNFMTLNIVYMLSFNVVMGVFMWLVSSLSLKEGVKRKLLSGARIALIVTNMLFLAFYRRLIHP